MKTRDFSKHRIRQSWISEIMAIREESRWETLAHELFSWQFEKVKPYQNLCRAYGVTPKNLSHWQDIPAVPQQLFKLSPLFSHPSKKPGAIYETSGTTTGQPGRQYILTTDVYRAVACAGQAATLLTFPKNLICLTPSPQDAPHSSLSAMFGFWAEHLNQPTSFRVIQDRIDFNQLYDELKNICQKDSSALALVGTAFSFVHLLDAFQGRPQLMLPPGSWLLETGGFKGRSREISKEELYQKLATQFGVSIDAIWNEYGMSELSSQAYSYGLHRGHHLPPWARVLIVDPATNCEIKAGHTGLVRWLDLANIDSVMALQTLDLAQARPESGQPYAFYLYGRLSRTELRGCSLSAEDLAQRQSKRLKHE